MSNFQPVAISACKDFIEHLRPTVHPYDVMPARFLKQVVHIVGSDVLNCVNLSLSKKLCWSERYCFKLVPELLNKPKILCTDRTIYFF